MNTNFKVIGLTQLGIKPKSTAPEADALTTQPSELYVVQEQLFTININMFVYSPSDTEHAVTAKLKRNNAIYRVDVFTLFTVSHWFTWPGDSEQTVRSSSLLPPAQQNYITSNRYNY